MTHVQPGHFTTRLLRRIKVQLGNWTDILQSQNLPSSCKPQPLSLILQFTGPGPESVECQLCGKDLQPDWRVWNKVFLLNLVKESVEDRQVQHTGESNATSAALAPNVACHKCLARESNPWHLCSNQGILPLDYWDGQNSSWGTGLMSCSLRICHHYASHNHYLSFCSSLGHGPESVSFAR